jgi:TRAP-type C4-dicarboxylate transport system permease small subunit
MKRFLSAVQALSKYTDWVAGTALILIMLLTSLDVIFRYLGYPIPGTYDMVSMGAAFVVGFAIPRTSWDRAHVSVDILIERMPRLRGAIDIGTRIIGLCFFLLLGWDLMKMGTSFARTGDSTQTISIPLYPVAFALALCAFAECVVLLSDIAKRAIPAGGNRE